MKPIKHATISHLLKEGLSILISFILLFSLSQSFSDYIQQGYKTAGEVAQEATYSCVFLVHSHTNCFLGPKDKFGLKKKNDSLSNTHAPWMNLFGSLRESVWGAYSRVFPVAYDLLQVGGWVEEEVLPPFIPLNCHSAIHVNAERERTEMERCPCTSGHAYILKTMQYKKFNITTCFI